MNAPVDAEALRRLRWNCRRGLLENDLMLDHFLRRRADRIDSLELERLNRLLEYDDNSLWDLLSGRASCEDAGLQAAVEAIRAA
jgi:antitoxin CptB